MLDNTTHQEQFMFYSSMLLYYNMSAHARREAKRIRLLVVASYPILACMHPILL